VGRSVLGQVLVTAGNSRQQRCGQKACCIATKLMAPAAVLQQARRLVLAAYAITDSPPLLLLHR
jgi:hypothetical protein